MSDIKSVVAKNISSLRTANGMTQLELAEKLNYSDKAVSKWEHADSMPDIAVLVEIADLFGVPMDYLVRAEHTEKEIKSDFKENKNYIHGVITAVSIQLVWFIAVLAFVLVSLIWKSASFEWLVFVYAIPVSSIVWLVFNSIWFNTRYNYPIISVLMWSALAAIQLSFIPFGINIWLIYLLGLPGQIIIVLCSILKKKPKIVQKRELSQQ